MDRYTGLNTYEKARRILEDVLHEMNAPDPFYGVVKPETRKDCAAAIIEDALRHHAPQQLPAARSAA